MLQLHVPGASAPLLRVWGSRVEYSCPHPGLFATLCYFLLLLLLVLLLLLLLTFLPTPAAKRIHLQLTCARVARAQLQSASVTCGDGLVEYS